MKQWKTTGTITKYGFCTGHKVVDKDGCTFFGSSETKQIMKATGAKMGNKVQICVQKVSK